MLSLLVCPLLVLLTAMAALAGSARDERRLILAGLGAHLVGVVAIVLYHEKIGGGGDMRLYHEIGFALCRVVQRDSRYIADIIKLGLHLDNDLALDMFAGTSSGTMCALMALCITIVGDNLYAICLAVSMFGFLGQVSMFRAVADKLEPVERMPVLTALMLVPSVVFWTSGFIKEAFVVGFLGLLCVGIARCIRRRSLARGLLEMGVGLTGTVTVKAYVLFPLILGLAAWLFSMRSSKLTLRDKVLALALIVGGIVALTRAFPEYGSGLAATVNLQQHNYDVINGANIDIVDSRQEPVDVNMGGQVKYFPLALVNALTRPMIFEARNAAVVVASLELTILLVLALSLARHGARTIARTIRRRPPLMFATVFVLSFSVAVGLTTRNLGTLSRYRVPAFPIYVGLVVALRARLAKNGSRGATSRPMQAKRLAPSPKRRAA